MLLKVPATTGPNASADALVGLLRSAGEATRFRILLLLAEGDLTVKDLTHLLGQSQPRISRHLKLMTEAGLIERFPEGSWVYYRLAETDVAKALAAFALSFVDRDDSDVARDAERLATLRKAHADDAAAYFATHAGDWAEVRALHVDEASVEAAILAAVGTRRIDSYLDLGTGTGRMLELLAGRYDRGVGIDVSHDMLAAARAEITARGLANVQLRHGDLYALALPRDSFDLVTLHQVLHYLDDPARAIREAARVLRPGGRLIVVDFAPHGLDFLREEHAHRRLGFSAQEVARWMEHSGLDVTATEHLDAAGAKLTVTLWTGRDTRILMADTPSAAAIG